MTNNDVNKFLFHVSFGGYSDQQGRRLNCYLQNGKFTASKKIRNL